MNRLKRTASVTALLLSGLLILASCGGGGGGDPSSTPTPTPTPPPVSKSEILETPQEATRFLSRASFGPTQNEITSLVGESTSDWYRRQMSLQPSQTLPYILNILSDPEYQNDNGDANFQGTLQSEYIFYINALTGDDQLRQRVAFALSQILVVSRNAAGIINSRPDMLAQYMDILSEHAFGNYRDLMQDVTYSPAMSHMLTYYRNRKEDMSKGRVPDENYARELMQLFTIGLVELNMDGTVKTDGSGTPIETYSNEDVEGLAKVFTGLSYESDKFWGDKDNDSPDRYHMPLKMFDEQHSMSEKSFLGTTIPADTTGETSINLALDAIFEHPNLAPFVSHQLIQRLITSNPEPDYVERVAAAFESGSYTLPDESIIGTRQRGDLAATIAAILFDDAAMDDSGLANNSFGKIREPILRFTHWARTFEAAPIDPETSVLLRRTYDSGRLSQGPYAAPSVFNFYRPGYVAPGTVTGAQNMTVPELQLVNASSLPGYVNFMTRFIQNRNLKDTFIPDYSDEIDLARDPEALVDHLDALLTYGQTSDETKTLIVELIGNSEVNDDAAPEDNGTQERVELAVLAFFTSPDYLVQN